MLTPPGGVDERTKDSLEKAVEEDEHEKLAEALDEALKHAEDEETEYWIRTALQHLLAGAR
ncbi:MAG: hypothetical protein ABEH47_00775 [Haloferacaceae archaeon]